MTRNSLDLRQLGLALVIGLLLVAAPATSEDRYAVDVAAGDSHSCAVTSCGDVTCWGRDDYGQAADRGPSPYGGFFFQAPYERVSVGQYHTCALDETGEIDCWGRSNYGQTAPPARRL